MKKLALFLLLCASPFCTTGQTFVKEIDCSPHCPDLTNLIINVPEGQMHGTDYEKGIIYIYNLNLELIKEIAAIQNLGTVWHVFKGYFTQSEKYEIHLRENGESKLYDEDGVLLFNFEDYFPFFIGDNQNEITKYNTIIAYNSTSEKARVYKVNSGSGINSEKAGLQNNAYPSPAKDIINIGYNIAGSALGTLVITDTSGKAVETILVGPHNNTASVDITSYPAGVYLYAIGEQSGKFIKK
jgi:hypothetical protein